MCQCCLSSSHLYICTSRCLSCEGPPILVLLEILRQLLSDTRVQGSLLRAMWCIPDTWLVVSYGLTQDGGHHFRTHRVSWSFHVWITGSWYGTVQSTLNKRVLMRFYVFMGVIQFWWAFDHSFLYDREHRFLVKSLLMHACVFVADFGDSCASRLLVRLDYRNHLA